MRSARTVVRQSIGSAPALVAACLLGAVACDDPEPLTPGPASFATGGSGGAAPSSSAAGLPSYCDEHLVEARPGGAASVVDAICSATVEPVLADGAAPVHLLVTNDDPHAEAFGSVNFPEELRAQVHGAPVITIQETNQLAGGSISTPEPTPLGYSFKINFGAAAPLFANDRTRLSLRVAFDFSCPTGSRLVHAVTELRLCGGMPVPVTWSGPGDTCAVCYVIQPASPATSDTEAQNR